MNQRGGETRNKQDGVVLTILLQTLLPLVQLGV